MVEIQVTCTEFSTILPIECHTKLFINTIFLNTFTGITRKACKNAYKDQNDYKLFTKLKEAKVVAKQKQSKTRTK